MNEKEVERIVSNIKSIRIQGATNIAKAALKAYSLSPTILTIKKLENSRPTEPLLFNVLKLIKKSRIEDIINHLKKTQESINKNLLKIIDQNSKIFTHCHSTTVVNALIYAKNQKRNFQVFNTETRPLFQGRKTARELSSSGIKVTMFIDSAAEQAIKKSDFLLFGADAILENGDVINKIGSSMFAKIAFLYKKPVYIVADSWKFSEKNIEIEQRTSQEIWKNVPKNVKIQNPSFDIINRKFISSIISELGILSPNNFTKKAKNEIP